MHRLVILDISCKCPKICFANRDATIKNLLDRFSTLSHQYFGRAGYYTMNLFIQEVYVINK